MRKLHPEGPLWTFWDYKRERWLKDKGMRLDHFPLSPEMSERLVDEIRGWVHSQFPGERHMKLLTRLALAQVEYEQIDKHLGSIWNAA